MLITNHTQDVLNSWKPILEEKTKINPSEFEWVAKHCHKISIEDTNNGPINPINPSLLPLELKIIERSQGLELVNVETETINNKVLYDEIYKDSIKHISYTVNQEELIGNPHKLELIENHLISEISDEINRSVYKELLNVEHEEIEFEIDIKPSSLIEKIRNTRTQYDSTFIVTNLPIGTFLMDSADFIREITTKLISTTGAIYRIGKIDDIVVYINANMSFMDNKIVFGKRSNINLILDRFIKNVITIDNKILIDSVYKFLINNIDETPKTAIIKITNENII